LINVVETLSEANKLTGEIINHAGAIKSIMIAKLINRFIKFPPLLKLESLFYIKSRILKIFYRVFEFVKVMIAFLIPLPSADHCRRCKMQVGRLRVRLSRYDAEYVKNLRRVKLNASDSWRDRN
jgi:hypothetical protein